MATPSAPSIPMARGFSALRDVYMYPRTLQQIFICALRTAQLALAILISQRASQLHVSALHRTAIGLIAILSLHLLCNGAVPKHWKRYEGDGDDLISVHERGGNSRWRQIQRFIEEGWWVSKRHMTVPVVEVALAVVFGTVFAVGIARLGAPGVYSGCQGPGGNAGECKAYGQLFKFVMAMEGLLGVTIAYWAAFLCWQILSLSAFCSVTLYQFPLLYLRKRRTVREYATGYQPEKDTVTPALDSVVVETAPRSEESSSKLYTVLGLYLTLSAIAPHLHHGDLLNLLLTSKRTHCSMFSAAGGDLRTIFSKTCQFTPFSIKVRCHDCGASLCRDEEWMDRAMHCQAGSPSIRRKHVLCEMVCTFCRYQLLLNKISQPSKVDPRPGCSCSTWGRHSVCGPPNAKVCRRRWKCKEQLQERHVIHLNGPGPVRRTYYATVPVVPATEGECYRCRKKVEGLRWWVYAWNREQFANRCHLDCANQKEHYMGTAET